MGVRVKQQNSGPEWVEIPFEERVTEVNGISFHWGPNQKRTFLDEGVGVAHAARSATDTIVEDRDLGDSRS